MLASWQPVIFLFAHFFRRYQPLLASYADVTSGHALTSRAVYDITGLASAGPSHSKLARRWMMLITMHFLYATTIKMLAMMSFLEQIPR